MDKFADDTSVVGLMQNDESAYRDGVQKLAVWCTDNNLALNSTKTKELIIDFRRRREEPAPLYIKGDMVERVTDFKFLDPGPDMDCEHHLSCQEGSAAFIFPEDPGRANLAK